MNRENLNKILIVVAIIIWGSGLYKYSKNRSFAVDKISNIDVEINDNPKAATLIKKETSFKLLDRDPFLGELISRPTTNVESRSLKNTKESKPQTDLWPTIEYFGFVKSENKKHPLALVKINGSLERKRPGKINKFFRIEAIYSDSLIISNGRQKKRYLVK